MQPSDEHLIESLIRAPSAMKPQDRARAEALVEVDQSAAQLAHFFGDLYSDFDRMVSSSPQVDALLDQLFPPSRVLHLRPLRNAMPDRPATTVVLAAMSPNAAARFETLATYSAAEDNVLVRLVLDRETNRGHVYVLAEDEKRRSHVLVSFPDSGMEIATDYQGRGHFRLSRDDRDRDWAGSPILLRVPVGRLEYSFETAEEFDLESYRVACGLENEGLAIRVTAREQAVPAVLFALVETEVDQRVVPIIDGVGRATTKAPQKKVVVRLYN
jgi:hypothetical protein